jgi:3-isopropylmalate/(R)-2-methylmalate dehydratase small subunit
VSGRHGAPAGPIARVRGRALPLRGDDIDTDRIIPARFLKSVTFEGLEEHLFEDDRAAGSHPVGDSKYAGAAVMIVGRNFGCGSSREHAPQAIARYGIRAVVGESFSEIFFGNALALGLPCVRVTRAEAHAMVAAVEEDPSIEVQIDLDEATVVCGALRCRAEMPDAAREALRTGAWDATGLLRDRPEEIDAVAARLPYVRAFDA